jgi:hypothetical protein
MAVIRPVSRRRLIDPVSLIPLVFRLISGLYQLPDGRQAPPKSYPQVESTIFFPAILGLCPFRVKSEITPGNMPLTSLDSWNPGVSTIITAVFGRQPE